jgi:hypothetical protein
MSGTWIKEWITKPANKYAQAVMPDSIRHPLPAWIPAFARMTNFEIFTDLSNKDRRATRRIPLTLTCLS